jgi:GNAT superfamily N-acetyltransferase
MLLNASPNCESSLVSGGEMAHPDLIIRPLEVADETNWRRLWSQYLEFYETTLAPEVYDCTFSRLVSPDEEDCEAHIALLNEQALGIVHCVFHIHLWELEKVCYLHDLFTVAEARNKGVGRALIEAVYRNADSKGVQTVYWMTQEFNNTARHLYDKIGKRTPFIEYKRA